MKRMYDTCQFCGKVLSQKRFVVRAKYCDNRCKGLAMRAGANAWSMGTRVHPYHERVIAVVEQIKQGTPTIEIARTFAISRQRVHQIKQRYIGEL